MLDGVHVQALDQVLLGESLRVLGSSLDTVVVSQLRWRLLEVLGTEQALGRVVVEATRLIIDVVELIVDRLVHLLTFLRIAISIEARILALIVIELTSVRLRMFPFIFLTRNISLIS